MNRNITKTILVLCILILVLSCIACKNSKGSNVDNEAGTENETQILEVPTIDIDIKNVEKETADFKKIDNYWCREIVIEGETWYQTAPVWTGERADVYDIKDMFIDSMASNETIFRNMQIFNKPDGTNEKILGGRLWLMIWLKPNYALDKEEDTDQLKEMYSLEIWDTFYPKDDKLRVTKHDIDCFNVALYEDWCSYQQKLTFKFYGVTEEQFNLYVKDGKFDYSSIMNDCKTGKRTFDKLVEEEITQTGKYYVDYNDIQGEKEYKYILFIVETDCNSSKYAFAITAMPYDINKNAVEKYNQWKEKNKAMFLGQK